MVSKFFQAKTGANMVQDFLWFVEYDLSKFAKTLIVTQTIAIASVAIAYFI